MIIETGDLRENARRHTGEIPASVLELESDRFVRARGGIRCELTAQRLNDDLLVNGTLRLEMEYRCARCAERFRKPLRVAEFIRSYPLSLENESIDLTADIREDILLALPMHPVCADECRGLCPGCGVNLNKERCACRPGASPGAWSVLDQLKLK